MDSGLRHGWPLSSQTGSLSLVDMEAGTADVRLKGEISMVGRVQVVLVQSWAEHFVGLHHYFAGLVRDPAESQ
jgi:hypothetical protein